MTSALSGTNAKIDNLQKEVNTKITHLENKVQILETENEKKDEDITTLKHTVINMQKALNSFDQKERSCNSVVSNLPESDIEIPALNGETGGILSTDIEKIAHLCKLMENDIEFGELSDLTISRIGKIREGFQRMIKITFNDTADRDKFVKNSSKLKAAHENWSKVYVKKDQHPVYLAENNRLRKKMAELRKLEENAGKTITIKNGKLSVDDTVIDQNLFFR